MTAVDSFLGSGGKAGAPSLSWHDCLKAIAPNQLLPPPAVLRAGGEVHSKIEAMFPGLLREQPRTYTDPSLPFTIRYRPDQFDPDTSTVYEVKNLRWVIAHLNYCIAQLSGYVYFQKAKHGVFLVYTNGYRDDGKRVLEGPWPWTPPFLYDWSTLRKIALDSYAILTRGNP